MSKIRAYSIPKQKRYQLVGEFFDIVHSLNTKQEIIDFFIGLFTTSESLMMARRIQIAKLLIAGKTYFEIRRELGVGNQTINNVYKWLHERDDAYYKILDNYFNKLEKMDKKKKEAMYKSKNLLDRYPQHRLLKKLLGL